MCYILTTLLPSLSAVISHMHMMLRSLVKIQYCTRALAVVVVDLELHLQEFLGLGTNVCLRHAKGSSLYLTRPLESTLGSRPLL